VSSIVAGVIFVAVLVNRRKLDEADRFSIQPQLVRGRHRPALGLGLVPDTLLFLVVVVGAPADRVAHQALQVGKFQAGGRVVLGARYEGEAELAVEIFVRLARPANINSVVAFPTLRLSRSSSSKTQTETAKRGLVAKSLL